MSKYETDIQELLKEMDLLISKDSGETIHGAKEIAPAEKDNMKALFLHGRILYLTAKMQNDMLRKIMRSSRILEALTVFVLTFTIFLYYATIFHI